MLEVSRPHTEVGGIGSLWLQHFILLVVLENNQHLQSNDEEIRKVFYCPFLLGIQFSGLTGFIYGESNTGAFTVTIFSTHLLGHKNKHISCGM